MAKQLNQLNVNLAFTADTNKAKAELKALRKSLNDLVTGTALKTPDFKFTKDIQEATRAAAQLRTQLDSAINVDTGNLDLTKFSESMKKSGMSLEKYQNQLYQLGPTGEKAFADLTRAITMADVPLKRSSKLLSELWTTMKNTARWQLTSSVLHGFMGAIQSAYGYAQDLNESLNNIRIVTEASTDKMAEFAKEANKAAKALSTTTTEYTNASLIYFQQGLNETQVAERTEVTIKMANAAGVSAEKVSDQLTAVWNNFYNGSKSLEYYADVMTALGAATASSTDEISEGLNKFAAVAETVGLSYEYAASALATVTATTRQSADVVGTAFKTLFARLQDLELGETLDDGTTLGKYSAALNSVGINIKDTNGQMKEMDDILDELGKKWQSLSKDTQVALAQTVAGTRQYTQLIALMDNWDYFQTNLSIAENSSGTLQKQADIYAESWEAAEKRVQASAEGVYSAILNDEFFIDLTNTFAELIDGVKLFIDGLGGIKGVLLAVGSIITNVFSKQIGEGIENTIHNIKMLTKAGRESEFKLKEKANETLIQGYKDSGTLSGSQNADTYSVLAKNQLNYIKNSSLMSEEELAINQMLMDRNRILADQSIIAGEALDKAKERIIEEKKSLEIQAQLMAQKKGGIDLKQFNTNIQNDLKGVNTLKKNFSILDSTAKSLEKTFDKGILNGEEFTTLKTDIKDTIIALTDLEKIDINSSEDVKKLADALGVTEDKARGLWTALSDSSDIKALDAAFSEIVITCGTNATAAFDKLKSTLMSYGFSTEEAENLTRDYLSALSEFGPKSVQASDAFNKLNNAIKNHNEQMDKTTKKPIPMAQAFSKAASAVMAMGQAFSTMQGIIDVFNDSEATTKDKIMALISGVGMLVPAIMAIAPAFSTASVGATLFGATATAAGTAASIAMWQVTLIVVAITAIVAAVALLVNKQSAAEKKAKRMAEAAEELAENAEKAQQKVEDLKSAFNSYDEVIKTLENCTKGTQEWYDALAQVEKEVLNIMQNFPELAKNANLFYRDLETGTLIINADERSKVISEAERAAQVAQAANLVGAAVASGATVDVKKQELKNQGYSTGIGDSYQKATNYNDAMETQVYAAYLDVSNIVADNAKELANLTEEEYAKKMEKLLKESSNGVDIYASQMQALIEESKKYQSEVNNLAEQTTAAANQMENAANLIASIELGDEYGAAEQEIASEIYESEVEKLRTMYLDVLTSDSGDIIKGWDGPTGINRASGANNEVYEMALEKLQEAGYKYDKQKDNAVRGTDSNRSFAFLDENGEEVTRTAEWVAQTIATNEALKKLGDAAEKAQASLQKLENNAGLEMGKAVKSLIANGNFDNLTEEDRDAIGTFANADALENYLIESGMDKDTLYESFGVENSDELFKKWQQAWKDNRTALDSAGQFLTKAVEDAFNGLDTKTLTADQKRALSEYMNTALVESGDISTFTNAYNKVAKDQRDEFLKAFDGVDWTTVSVDEFREKLKQTGVTASFSNSELEQLIDSMGTAAEKSLDYAKVMKIIGDIKIGDTISAEDYKELGDGYEEYFRLMADGTYQLTSDADEFYNLVKENALQQFINKINQASNSNKNIDNVVEKFNTDYRKKALTENTYYIGYRDSQAFNKNAAQNQLEFLTATGAIDSTTLSTWQAIIDDRDSGIDVDTDKVLKSTLEEMNAAVAQNQHFWEGWQDTVNTNNKIIEQNIIQYLSSAESLNEFDELLLKLKDETGLNNISTEIYSQALKMLGSQYENCSQEIKTYEEALSSGTIEEIENAEAKLKSAIATGELAKQYDLNAELLETQAGLYKDYYTNLELSDEAAIRLSAQNLRMNEGVKTLYDNWKDYVNILNISDGKIGDVDKTSSDYAQTLSDLKDIVIELTGADKDLAISNEFIEDNIDKIEGAAKGETKAIQQLGTALAQFQIDSLESTTSNLQKAFGNLKEEELQKEFNNARDAVKNGMQIIQDAIGSGAIELGADLSALTELPDFDFNDWITQINNVATAAAMSKEELLSMFETMGMDVEPDQIILTPVTVKEQVPTYSSTITSDGKNGFTMETHQSGVKTVEYTKEFATLKESPKIQYSGSGNVGPSSLSSSKSNSGSKKPDKIDKDRYKKLNDSLETVSDAMSDAEKAADRLYGTDRLKQMEKVNDKLLKEIDLQKRKRKEAEEYLKSIDKPALEGAFKALSSEFGLKEEIQLQFNTDGSIKNIEAIMNMIIDTYNAKSEELKDSMREADQELLENMKATIEAFKDAIGQYDDTRSVIREAENARQDAFNKWQDNNYEWLSYSLEINLEINEAELRDLEYRINRLGDTAAEMAEAIGLIYSPIGGSQYNLYNESMWRYANQKNILDSAYNSGEISQADYIEGLQEVSNGIYENLEALADLDKTMMEYYGNTLAAANEELDKFIDRMSHSAGILEHYSSIMNLLGKSSDYKTMNVILEGQANIAENQVKSSKAIMEMMQSEAEERYRAYQEALISGNGEGAELYLKQYEEALAVAQEAEDEYLSNAEQWAESLKAILENKLADLGKTLEQALTGGTSFEQLTTQMERAASLQEEYLTSTNQIYETTKMMRAAQQEIDKTTNTVAKNKIANFIVETKQLQNQSKLSRYELDVQQAKYDLLLAEIALQEAQNAKSTVRLQRDAQGNFGYVYTADSSAIADATQKYEDAQNALYNIGLEGANDYGQKYQQTMNEMYDSLTELQNQYLFGAFESESAYNLAVEEAKRYYYAKLEQYSSLYATATTTDSRVVAEAWFNDFSEMMTTSETWKLAVEKHVANVSSAFGEWQTQVETIASDAGIGGDLESLKLKVNEIADETNNLTNELTKQGGTIDSLQNSLDTVKKNTDAYAALREQLQIVAERYRQVAKDASAAAAAQNLIKNSAENGKDLSILADEYAKKLKDAWTKMQEELKEIKEKYLNGEITPKEYEDKVNRIKKDYYEKLEQYSGAYREVLAKDNDLVAEDWFLTFEEMIEDQEAFNQSVDEYLKEIEDDFNNMNTTTKDVAAETGEALDTVTADVDEVKKAIDLLNQSIVGSAGLKEAFEAQDKAVGDSEALYEGLNTKLQTVIETYKELADAAREAARAQSSVSGTSYQSGSSGGTGKYQVVQAIFDDNSFIGLDTGGYTGQWGSYGKLAMLHEKELVLNKGDTENFLASMGILNNILQTIDLQSANAQIGGILTTPSFHGGGNDMLEQNVHIEASFPNVQNSSDIEEAFNNLINRASQYANRK